MYNVKRLITGLILLFIIAGCSDTQTRNLEGGDCPDKKQWCEPQQKCLSPWEMPCEIMINEPAEEKEEVQT